MNSLLRLLTAALVMRLWQVGRTGALRAARRMWKLSNLPRADISRDSGERSAIRVTTQPLLTTTLLQNIPQIALRLDLTLYRDAI